MGNKFPIVSVLLLVICLPAAAWISHDKLTQMQTDMYKDVPEQAKRVYMPALGFDKFYADTKWVNLVQDMGKASATSGKKLSPAEEEAKKLKKAEFFYEEFLRLTELDPNNETYYLNGSSTLQNDLPDKAIELLQRGDKMLRNPSYHYPFTEYFIKNNVIAFNDEEKRKEMADDLSKLLKEAMDRPGAPSYIQNKWLRLEAKRNGLEDDDVNRLKLWTNYYVKKTTESITENGDDSASDAETMSSFDVDEKLRGQIMQMAQKMAIEIWEQKQGASDAKKKELDKKLKKVKKEFNRVAPPAHYSPVSLMPYAAGDLYDAYTGTPVEPYGVDPELLKKGIIAIYKGPYSHVTGNPRVKETPPGPVK